MTDQETIQKRYIATASFYVYAESDVRAIELCEKIVKTERDLYDNRYSVDCIEEKPFGKFVARKLDITNNYDLG
ncbi:MAG: hypothetical protein A2Z57_11200 [Planctomycetes bacterium RIFCSPHIGHO2_12_39_6]|nr:MAG: hypothetical protein A2Z57_11200 [Planctomycetes bacterium RIFCSPHIGHO2_12_39_6]